MEFFVASVSSSQGPWPYSFMAAAKEEKQAEFLVFEQFP